MGSRSRFEVLSFNLFGDAIMIVWGGTLTIVHPQQRAIHLKTRHPAKQSKRMVESDFLEGVS
jgi:hypothetical protein